MDDKQRMICTMSATLMSTSTNSVSIPDAVRLAVDIYNLVFLAVAPEATQIQPTDTEIAAAKKLLAERAQTVQLSTKPKAVEPAPAPVG